MSSKPTHSNVINYLHRHGASDPLRLLKGLMAEGYGKYHIQDAVQDMLDRGLVRLNRHMCFEIGQHVKPTSHGRKA